jgi:hypothetical protein
VETDRALVHILLVEDDPEYLELLIDTVPDEVGTGRLRWHPCDSFEDALGLLELIRFDIVVTDVYRGPIADRDAAAIDLLAEYRKRRFVPVVFISSGPRPSGLECSSFVLWVDKSDTNEPVLDAVESVIDTRLPAVMRRLHDELDSEAATYIWPFIQGRWEELKSAGLCTPESLERLLRRRTAVQLGRLVPASSSAMEVSTVTSSDFYLMPPVSGVEFRLGDIWRHKESQDVRVALTPHCQLLVQPGKPSPKADHVLTVGTVPAGDVIATEPPKGKTAEKRLRGLGRRLQSPAEFGTPAGRYWFLPGFLDIPDLYCDLLSVESLPLGSLTLEYDVMGR